MVEFDDRRRLQTQQHFVEADDLRPVGLLVMARPRVQRRDRGLHRIDAWASRRGQRALDLIDTLGSRGDLAGYHLLPSVRANLLNRLGRREEARAAYQEALALAKLDPERRLIVKRLAELDS